MSGYEKDAKEIKTLLGNIASDVNGLKSEVNQLKDEAKKRNGRLDRMEDFVHLPKGDSVNGGDETIKSVIRETNRETIADALTWKNIAKVGGVVSGMFVGILQMVNLAFRIFGG